MEKTRIRYNEIVDGVCQSKQAYRISTGKEVKVELDFNNFEFRIIDAISGNKLLSGGSTRNKSVLKIQAKRSLEALGVSFAEEVRPSRKLSQSVASVENSNQ